MINLNKPMIDIFNTYYAKYTTSDTISVLEMYYDKIQNLTIYDSDTKLLYEICNQDVSIVQKIILTLYDDMHNTNIYMNIVDIILQFRHSDDTALKDFVFSLDCDHMKISRAEKFVNIRITPYISHYSQYSAIKSVYVALNKIYDLSERNNTDQVNREKLASTILKPFLEHKFVNSGNALQTQLAKLFKILCRYNKLDEIKALISVQCIIFKNIFYKIRHICTHYPSKLLEIINSQFPSDYSFYCDENPGNYGKLLYNTKQFGWILVKHKFDKNRITDVMVKKISDELIDNMAYPNKNKDDNKDKNKDKKLGTCHVRIMETSDEVKNTIYNACESLHAKNNLMLLGYGSQLNSFKLSSEDLIKNVYVYL